MRSITSKLALFFLIIFCLQKVFAAEPKPFSELGLLAISAEKLDSINQEKNLNKKLKALNEVLAAAKKMQSEQEKINSEMGHPSEDALNRFILQIEEITKIKNESLEKNCARQKFNIERDKTNSWDYSESKKWLKAICP